MAVGDPCTKTCGVPLGHSGALPRMLEGCSAVLKIRHVSQNHR